MRSIFCSLPEPPASPRPFRGTTQRPSSAADAHFHQDLHPGDIACWPTSLGWMMGPWLVFATLLNRATMALWTQAPTDGRFGMFVQDAGVTMLGAVPSLVRAWRQSQCMAGLDWTENPRPQLDRRMFQSFRRALPDESRRQSAPLSNIAAAPRSAGRISLQPWFSRAFRPRSPRQPSA